MGLPVVATSVGGSPEQVRADVTGFLIPPGDSEALENALLSLIRDENLRATMSEAALDCCRREFSLEKMIARMEEFYLRL